MNEYFQTRLFHDLIQRQKLWHNHLYILIEYIFHQNLLPHKEFYLKRKSYYSQYFRDWDTWMCIFYFNRLFFPLKRKKFYRLIFWSRYDESFIGTHCNRRNSRYEKLLFDPGAQCKYLYEHLLYGEVDVYFQYQKCWLYHHLIQKWCIVHQN